MKRSGSECEGGIPDREGPSLLGRETGREGKGSEVKGKGAALNILHNFSRPAHASISLCSLESTP